MAQAVALAAIVGMTASFGVGLAALVLRYRSRRIPGWLAVAAIATFGLANGTTFILFIRDWAILLGLLPIAAGLGYFLDRAGRRTWAGWLMLTLGVPGMLWWGYFLLEDALTAAVGYEPVLWLWWTGPTILVLGGLAIVLFGERPPPSTELYPRQPSHARPPLALADAIRRELGAPPIGLPQAVAGGAGIIVLVLLTVMGPLLDLPWPLTWLLAAGAYAVVATLQLGIGLLTAGLITATDLLRAMA